MNSSLNGEVIYLSLNANTKTSEVYTFIQTAPKMGNTKSAAYPRNHRYLDENCFSVLIIVPICLWRTFFPF